jgi:hypothetical protein
MREPDRLASRSGLGADLLRAARRESPPASARLRAKAVMGVAAGAATPHAASGLAATATHGVAMKLASLAVVVCAAGAVVVASSRPKPGMQPAAPMVAPTPTVSVEALPAQGAEVARTPAPASSALGPAAEALAPSPLARPSHSGAAPAPERGLAEHPLGDEVAALAEAKLALANGHPTESLGLVDRYFAAFPHPHLRPEAEALRIEALAARGDKEGARSFLTAFRAAHPDSALLEHLDAITTDARAPR